MPGRVYPWGNEEPSPTCDRVLWNRCPGENGAYTRAVGGFAASGGLYDLAGSVWEWTADYWRPYPMCRTSTMNPICKMVDADIRVVHGGAYGVNTSVDLRSATRAVAPPTDRQNFIGFRCARSR